MEEQKNMAELTKLQKQLFELQDLKYRDFHSKLMPETDKETVIGIRTPVLRKFAKEFAGTSEAEAFLRQLPHRYYEENNLHMMLITGIKDYEKCMEEIQRFLPCIDNWATWCGPCRMANKVMAPMKEELKDKDIVYLYITGEVSPQKTWENMIPDIHGEHYRLTNAQWEYLSKSFGIRGVPTYLIIDRKGDIKFKQTGFPGVEKMKEELLKVTD